MADLSFRQILRKVYDATSVALSVVNKAGTAVIGKVRLVTATGDEITDDTLDAMKVALKDEPLTYSAPAKVAVGSSTTEILAINASRRYAGIVNDSDEEIYLGVGAAAVMNQGVLLSPGGSMEFVRGQNLSTQAINGICTSGSKNVTVQEAV